MKTTIRALILVFVTATMLPACSSKKPAPPAAPVYETQRLKEGEATYVWDEPVVDVVDVPPGLDPDGVYYRPGHKKVVEIRQGRWRYEKGAEDLKD